MNIETLVYKVIQAEIAETYRFKSPTPGIGSYVVLDMVSDITAQNKDTATLPHAGTKCRMQAKIYSSDADTARSMVHTCQTIIRTTTEHTDTGVTWVYASDTAGVQGGYTPGDKRFYYIIDFVVYYKQSSI